MLWVRWVPLQLRCKPRFCTSVHSHISTDVERFHKHMGKVINSLKPGLRWSTVVWSSASIVPHCAYRISQTQSFIVLHLTSYMPTCYMIHDTSYSLTDRGGVRASPPAPFKVSATVGKGKG